MKIFLFDPETGIYQGEDFAEAIPPGATAIMPPQPQSGSYLRFVESQQRWEVHPLKDRSRSDHRPTCAAVVAL